MTSDVVVRRCVVRVVRHGGWSWGVTAQQLADRVAGALPQVITGYLDGLTIPDGDAEITEPVRIAIRVPASRVRKLWHPAGHAPPADMITMLSGRSLADALPLAAHGQRAAAGAADEALTASAAAPAWPAEEAQEGWAAGPADVPIAKGSVPGLVPAERGETPQDRGGPQQRGVNPPLAGEGESAAERLLRYLLRLHETGELQSLLALLPLPALELWCRVLNSGVARDQDKRDESDLPLAGVLRHASADQALITRIVSLFTLTSELRTTVPAGGQTAGHVEHTRNEKDTGDGRHTDSERLIDRGKHTGHGFRTASNQDQLVRAGREKPPIEDEIRDALRELAQLAGSLGTDSLSRLVGSPRSALMDTKPRPTALRQAVTAEVDLESALPFLLLGPLHRIGYLDAIPSALDAAGLTGSAHLFATALACTVLGPLRPGWRRTPSGQSVVAAFAGLPERASEPALASLARQAGPAVTVLNAVLARSLTAGHTLGEPLLLTAASRNGGGLILADSEGIFPISWIDQPGQAVDAWRASSSPLILVGSSAATPHTLAALAAAGIRFVIDVPPTHREPWRRLTPHRLWTNDDTSPARQLAPNALTLQDSISRLDEVITQLAGERLAVPLTVSTALARGMTLAAAVALGTIAWTLWKDRESPDPLLALERFGDLSARVRIEADRVTVRLPLGRRHADLYEHGFLADVPAVPWLPGRVVEFSGW